MSGLSPKQIEHRLKVAAALLTAVFVLLGGRLWYLQVLRGEDLDQKSRSNAIRLITIPAPRGVFYDRRHRALVSSRLAFSVSVIPRELDPDPWPTFQRLAPLIRMTAADIAAEVKKGEGQPYYPVRLARDADPATVTRVEEARLDLPGVIVEEIPVRNYIYGSYASHLFGYLGKVSPEEWKSLKGAGYAPSDVVGKTGLEKQFEKLLRGKDGGQQVEVNRVNRPVRVLGTVEPVPGNSLLLTIDQRVQKAAEEALDAQLEWARRNTGGGRGAAVVALDPNTGAVLAMASRPAFDPSRFVGGVSASYWQEIVSNPANAFQDRVTEAALAPGSTFKAVTAIAALSERVTNDKEIFIDNGSDPVYPEKHCWLWNQERRTHGPVNIEEGLKVSCNIVFYELGRRVGRDPHAPWSRQLGLGTPTGFDLYPGEYAGNVPDRNWKRRTFKRADSRIWYPIETLDVSIGQGALQVTPIQLASLYALIANGGTMYRPFVVQSVLSPDGHPLKVYGPEVRRRLDLNPRTLDVVRKGLGDVVAGGTAAGAFVGFPIAVAGKTGSAEISANSKDTHAWFASFAPVDHPQIVVVVMMERGGHGGSAAAPVARKVLEAYFGLDKPAPAPQPVPARPGSEMTVPGPATTPQATPAPPTAPTTPAGSAAPVTRLVPQAGNAPAAAGEGSPSGEHVFPGSGKPPAAAAQ
jgi:penicillin-binding protein 2